MNYSLLGFFFRKKSRTDGLDARTGMYSPELLYFFLSLFLGGPFPSLSAESSGRWKPAAVGRGLRVDVRERGLVFLDEHQSNLESQTNDFEARFKLSAEKVASFSVHVVFASV